LTRRAIASASLLFAVLREIMGSHIISILKLGFPSRWSATQSVPYGSSLTQSCFQRELWNLTAAEKEYRRGEGTPPGGQDETNAKRLPREESQDEFEP
jgi:hypothetical protein